MKKLMLILAGVALAASTQAASISWKSGTAVKAPGSDGVFGTANAASGTLSMYVFIIDQASYDSLDVANVVNSYKDQTSAATASKVGFGGAAGGMVSTSHDDWIADQNTTYYAVILLSYKDGDTEMFIGNKASAIINGSGAGGVVNNLAKFEGGGTSGTKISGWTTAGAVPEPTSALLVLLGVAGLALRRKQG